MNLPLKIVVANFHALYFVIPTGTLTKSGIGINAAVNAPTQAYLLRSLKRNNALFLAGF
jgi:hypothetical protein